MNESTSTSGILTDEELNVNRDWEITEEIPTKGYCRLLKGKRYGVWYVLKTLKEAYMDKAIYRELIRKEFDISVKLQHPHILHTTGWENVPSIGDCIISEYIDGMTLETFLQTRPEKKTRQRIADELTEALKYIHSKQIVHRDLKPSNILITHNGNSAKIIDFGLSDTDAYCILKQGAGTEGYSEPEQLSGECSDIMSDIYSLGKILKKLDLSYPYPQVADKCTARRTLRFKSIRDLERSLRHRRIGLNAMLILTPVILLTLWSMVMVPEKQEIPLSHQETAQDQVETYITRGKELIDKAMTPAKSYADTVKEKNYGTFMQFLDLTDTITHIRNNFCQSIYQKEGAHFGQQIETALSKYQMDFLIQASKDFGINKE